MPKYKRRISVKKGESLEIVPSRKVGTIRGSYPFVLSVKSTRNYNNRDVEVYNGFVVASWKTETIPYIK